MTLILSCATLEFVFQVSDRRLSYVDGPKAGTVADDEANKSVIVGHRMAFGYTGLATIGGQSTDEWLTYVAAEGSTQDLKQVCDRICDRATEAFIKHRINHKRHAFVGVGWTNRQSSPDTLQPTLITISNAVGSDGEWLPNTAPRFTLQVNNWGRAGAGFGIAATGQTLKPEEKYAIWRLIRRCVKKHAGPSAMLRALIMSMEFLAGRYTKIGRSLMAVSMPRVASERYAKTGDALFIAGLPLVEQNTFLYLKPGGSAIAYGPHVAADGSAMLHFSARPIHSPKT